MLLLSAARHSRNQTLGAGVHPRPGWRGARNGEAVRLLTPIGVPGGGYSFSRTRHPFLDQPRFRG